jgi:protein-tyrosine phosphatase
VIDIHHHCLPALDDGPRELEEAVALCRQSADEGISTIVCTPHVLRGRWQNDSRQVLEAAMSRLQDALGGGPPQLLLGSEYFFAHDITEVLESGRGIVPLAGSRYVLVEFAAHVVPPMVEQPLYRMQLGGWIPVIAHPERNSIFQAKPELLASLVRLGAKVQVTAASFLGDFGADAERVAKELLERELVHVVATDAHNLTRRPPRAYAAREAVTRLAGAARAEALFVTNPAAIVRNDGLVYDPDLPYTAAPAAGWFGRLRKLLNQ